MKRLLKISLDLALLSFIPVLSWFVLSLIVDKNLINIFTLTYPLQFIWYILKSVFSTGANISKEKDKNKNAVMSGLFMGSIVGAIIFGLFALNIETYINFMNMDVSIYKEFALYSVIQLYIQLILAFILNKLYYENKNTLANKYSIIFNFLNFSSLVLFAVISKNKYIIVFGTLVILLVYTLSIVIKEYSKFKLRFNLLNFIKYDSVELFQNISFFIIFLFGLKNAMSFGNEFTLALTFVSLITDTQWDVFDAISTVATIDISKNKFSYKEHRKNAYKLLGIILLSIAVLFIVLYPLYNLDFNIVLIFLSFEIINFILYPLYRIKTAYLQLEYSAFKTTTNKLVSNILRMVLSFLSTPYCTGIGQVSSTIYQFITINYIYNREIKKDKKCNNINEQNCNDTVILDS